MAEREMESGRAEVGAVLDSLPYRPTPAPSDEATIRLAMEEVFRLCTGPKRQDRHGQRGRDWTMCIPTRPDDSDVVIMDGLRVAERLRTDLSTALARIDHEVEVNRLAAADVVSLRARLLRIREGREREATKLAAVAEAWEATPPKTEAEAYTALKQIGKAVGGYVAAVRSLIDEEGINA